MSNTFEIKIEDDDGAVASAIFYAYLTEAAAIADTTWTGSGKATLTETQPITCDPHGEATIHHASAETLYIKVVNETEVTGVRCVNVPLLSSYDVKATPLAADLIVLADTADSNLTKSATIASLATALGTPVAGVGTAKITVSTSAASGGADGDIWIQVT